MAWIRLRKLSPHWRCGSLGVLVPLRCTWSYLLTCLHLLDGGTKSVVKAHFWVGGGGTHFTMKNGLEWQEAPLNSSSDTEKPSTDPTLLLRWLKPHPGFRGVGQPLFLPLAAWNSDTSRLKADAQSGCKPPASAFGNSLQWASFFSDGGTNKENAFLHA